MALFLAAIGIYGVLAYQVSQRRREIGIRMALGAASGSIFSLVLREGGLIVGAGAALGLLGAFFLRQTLQAQLYETGAMDPAVVAAVAGDADRRRVGRVRVAGAASGEDGSADRAVRSIVPGIATSSTARDAVSEAKPHVTVPDPVQWCYELRAA